VLNRHADRELLFAKLLMKRQMLSAVTTLTGGAGYGSRNGLTNIPLSLKQPKKREKKKFFAFKFDYSHDPGFKRENHDRQNQK